MSENCAPCKGGDFQWVRIPPGDGSFQPEAVGAAEEVTNPSKPLMSKDLWVPNNQNGAILHLGWNVASVISMPEAKDGLWDWELNRCRMDRDNRASPAVSGFGAQGEQQTCV